LPDGDQLHINNPDQYKEDSVKKKIFKLRLPMEAVNILRHRGSAHSSPKGQKGYDRNKEKEKLRRPV
jgi:hypothetical protein